MKGVCRTQDLDTIGTGAGYIQIGDASTSLQDIGAIEGSVNEVTTRESLQLFDGQPMLMFYEEVIREMSRIETTLIEKNIQQMAKQLGYTTTYKSAGGDIDDTYAVQDDVVVTNEMKRLYFNTTYRQYSWAHLYWRNVKASPAAVVKTNVATPVTIDPANYVIDLTAGAIRAVAGGTITNGQEVLVTYTATRGSTYGVHIGGSMTKNQFMLRFVYPMRNGGANIIEYNRAFPGNEFAQPFNTGDWNKRPFAFNAAADFTMDEGERIKKMWVEAAAV